MPVRYELKWVLPGQQLAQAELWVRLHPLALRTAYPPRWVNSLYLDSPQLAALADNLDGVGARAKLRLRWYGSLTPAERPILELKRKQGMVGSKEQLALRGDADLNRTWRSIFRGLREELPPLWLSRWQAASQPCLLNRYWRQYFATHDGAIRVTLDSRQAAYEQGRAARPNLHTPLPLEDVVIIEMKADRSHADRLVAAASAFPIPRTRNSKYAKGMLSALYSR